VLAHERLEFCRGRGDVVGSAGVVRLDHEQRVRGVRADRRGGALAPAPPAGEDGAVVVEDDLAGVGMCRSRRADPDEQLGPATVDPGPDRGRPGSALQRRGVLLAALTIAWNAIEAGVAIAAGLAAGSIALVGFGFDSTIEVGSAVVVVWQLRGGYDEDRERVALRLIAVSFFVLATYVIVEAVRDLFFVDGEADDSTVGIVLASLSLIVMPVLALAKRRTATRLGSPTLHADAAGIALRRRRDR
jgi:Cation efflux family